VALAQAETGPVVVSRISEKMELDDAALRLLADARLVPESSAVVVGKDATGVSVKTENGEHIVPLAVAQLMYVRAN
jgi:hypothetical protein